MAILYQTFEFNVLVIGTGQENKVMQITDRLQQIYTGTLYLYKDGETFMLHHTNVEGRAMNYHLGASLEDVVTNLTKLANNPPERNA